MNGKLEFEHASLSKFGWYKFYHHTNTSLIMRGIKKHCFSSENDDGSDNGHFKTFKH